MKKGSISRISGIILVFVTALLLFGCIAFADNSLELHQTGATASTITVHHIFAGEAYSYSLYYRVHSVNGEGEYKHVGNYRYSNTRTINGLDPGTRYDVRLKVINNKNKTSYFTVPIVAVTAPNSKKLAIKQTNATETSVSFIVGGAGGITNEYFVKYYPSNDTKTYLVKKFTSKEDEFKNEFTIDELTPNRKYIVEITPCFRVNYIDPTVTDSEQSFLAKGKTVNFKKYPLKLIPSTTVDGLYQTNKGGKFVTVKWNAKNAVDGYRVYLLDNESEKTIKTGDVSKNTAKISVDTCGIYKIQVQPFTSFNGEHHYGPLSKIITASTSAPNHAWNKGVIQEQATYDKEGVVVYTCKYCSATKKASIDKKVYDKVVTIRSIKTANGTITLIWNKLSGAKGYCIYRKDPETNKFELVKEITDPAVLQWTDNSELIKGRQYSYTMKPFIIYNNNKYLSTKYSKTKSIVVK